MTKYGPLKLKSFFIRLISFIIMIYIDWRFTMVAFGIYVFLLLNDFIFERCREGNKTLLSKKKTNLNVTSTQTFVF